MTYAIVRSGSRQYRAEEGRSIEVERLPVEVGAKVELEALLVADGETVEVGQPTVPGAKVTATVAEHVKGEKIRIFKYKPKVRYRLRGGHRQRYTRLTVEQIKAGK